MKFLKRPLTNYIACDIIDAIKSRAIYLGVRMNEKNEKNGKYESLTAKVEDAKAETGLYVVGEIGYALSDLIDLGFDAGILAVGVIVGIQRQDGTCQLIHDVLGGCLHHHIHDKARRKLPVHGQVVIEGFQLVHCAVEVGQRTVENADCVAHGITYNFVL